jgi:hypothetical protein
MSLRYAENIKVIQTPCRIMAHYFLAGFGAKDYRSPRYSAPLVNDILTDDHIMRGDLLQVGKNPFYFLQTQETERPVLARFAKVT